jgi:hypothetical protein
LTFENQGLKEGRDADQTDAQASASGRYSVTRIHPEIFGTWTMSSVARP